MRELISKKWDWLKSKKMYYGIGAFYVMASLAIGEFHPFSNYPMYNSFPNWSYVFYFTDKNGDIILNPDLGTNSGELTHIYYSLCEKYKVGYGFDYESEKEKEKLGEELVKILSKRKNFGEPIEVDLHRKYFHLENKEMIKDDEIIYHGTLQ